MDVDRLVPIGFAQDSCDGNAPSLSNERVRAAIVDISFVGIAKSLAPFDVGDFHLPSAASRHAIFFAAVSTGTRTGDSSESFRRHRFTSKHPFANMSATPIPIIAVGVVD